MILNKKHSALVYFACYILSVALLVPYAVKLAHVFENHEHVICIDYQKTHLHEFDIDCEFYKYKLNNQFSHTLIKYDLINPDFKTVQPELHYVFISQEDDLQFSLRGPPHIV